MNSLTSSAPSAFAAYPEAVDLAFGPYAKLGVIVKEYRNASIIYTPSEMVGTKRTGRRGIDEQQPRPAGLFMRRRLEWRHGRERT